MRKRKIILCLLIAVMLLSFPIAAHAYESGSTGSLTWEFYPSSGALYIEGNGDIPDYSTYGAPWYELRNDIKTVNVSDGVTAFGNNAFESCVNLESINFPMSLKRIGEWVFYDCNSLTHIALPDGLTSLGRSAFNLCTSLKEGYIPDSVTDLGPAIFYECPSITSAHLPSNIKSIDRHVFAYCSSLTSINIPRGVTSIGRRAFIKCTALRDVYFGGSKSEWDKVTIGDDNTYLKRATKHYAISGSGSSSNTTTTAKKKQTIKCKSSYTTTLNKVWLHINPKAKTGITGDSSNNRVCIFHWYGNNYVEIVGCGTATITLKAKATSEYKAATKKIKITVKPGKINIESKKYKNKKITVKFTNQPGASGYNVDFSNKSSFNPKFSNTLSSKAKKAVFSGGVYPGRKYYIRIRAFKKISGKTLYGKWKKISVHT